MPDDWVIVLLAVAGWILICFVIGVSAAMSNRHIKKRWDDNA